MKALVHLRNEIDRADEALVEALAKRMAGVRAIATVKATLGRAVLDTEREQQVLAEAERRAVARGLDPEVAHQVLREVIALSRRLQTHYLGDTANAPSRVAYQGVPGAYSWIAARAHFSGVMEPVGYRTFAQTLDAVLASEAEAAVVPVENTIAGSIYEVLDELAVRDLAVVGEEVLRIEHCLVGLQPLAHERITAVLSHPVALAQCGRFLRRLAHAECRACVDTAEAVERVLAEGCPTQVAIASRAAAELRGLPVIDTDVADHKENFTRFWVVSRAPCPQPVGVAARTSLLLITDHRHGALVAILQPLADHGVNITRLESRPIRGTPWQYSFFLDVDGDIHDPSLAIALEAMRQRARVLRVLGCYPRAVLATEGNAQPALPLPSARPTSGPTRRQDLRVPSRRGELLASRVRHPEPTVVCVGRVEVGEPGTFVVIAGPCAVESATQINAAARLVRASGGVILRGSAYKPRTNPYSFQGLGERGVDLLVAAGRAHGLPVVTEVLSPDQVAPLAERVDLLQVGARNMQNFPLLRELGRCPKSVLLKRGLSATIEELLQAAEYVLAGGNQQVILCERGIRTFSTAMRATLDLGAVVVLKERTHLPIIVDPSHAAGRREWVAPLARAAKAVGAAGIIVEIHPSPAQALCDAEQALGPEEFAALSCDLLLE